MTATQSFNAKMCHGRGHARAAKEYLRNIVATIGKPPRGTRWRVQTDGARSLVAWWYDATNSAHRTYLFGIVLPVLKTRSRAGRP